MYVAPLYHRVTWGSVPNLEVLVSEPLSVDGIAAGSVASCEVAALDHESRDDTMEASTFVAVAVLPCVKEFIC